jgi:hypothetical protein
MICNLSFVLFVFLKPFFSYLKINSINKLQVATQKLKLFFLFLTSYFKICVGFSIDHSFDHNPRDGCVYSKWVGVVGVITSVVRTDHGYQFFIFFKLTWFSDKSVLIYTTTS